MWCIHNAIEFEKKGVPTVTISTSNFASLIKETAGGKGFSDLPIVSVSHPIGGIDPYTIKKKADEAIEDLVKGMTVPSESRRKIE